MPVYYEYRHCNQCGCNSFHIYEEEKTVGEGGNDEQYEIVVYFFEICLQCSFMGYPTYFHFKTPEESWKRFTQPFNN